MLRTGNVIFAATDQMQNPHLLAERELIVAAGDNCNCNHGGVGGRTLHSGQVSTLSTSNIGSSSFFLASKPSNVFADPLHRGEHFGEHFPFAEPKQPKSAKSFRIIVRRFAATLFGALANSTIHRCSPFATPL